MNSNDNRTSSREWLGFATIFSAMMGASSLAVWFTRHLTQLNLHPWIEGGLVLFGLVALFGSAIYLGRYLAERV